MKRTISPGLKTTFLVHAIVSTILGLGFVLIPMSIVEWLTLPVPEDISIRLLGVTLLTLGVMSWMALRETLMDRVHALVQLQIIWDVLALLVFIWALFVGPTQAAADQLRTNAAVWVFALLIAAFAVGFGFFYAQEEEYEVPDVTQEHGRTGA